jgi:hypothetical protein
MNVTAVFYLRDRYSRVKLYNESELLQCIAVTRNRILCL